MIHIYHTWDTTTSISHPLFLSPFQLAHLYTKLRKDFGKHCQFSAVPAEILEIIPVSEAYKGNYVLRNPSIACFDTAPHM